MDAIGIALSGIRRQRNAMRISFVPVVMLAALTIPMPAAEPVSPSSVVVTAPTGDVIQTVRAVLSEAERLGLPSLEGATLYEGALFVPGTPKWRRSNAASVRHIHARLPDGSWLVDLLEPVPMARLERTLIAGLKPFVPGAKQAAPEADMRWMSRSDLLIEARRVAVGVAEAADRFPPTIYNDSELTFYPRQTTPSDPGEVVRFACGDYFLARHQGDAAVAIVPERWRSAMRRMVDRRALPDPLPAGPVGLVAAFPVPEVGQAIGVDVPLLPEVNDAALIALTGDHTPAVVCATVGETALYLLGQRWGIDPAALAGRNAESPFDDAEQDAVAAGLAAWWKRTDGQPMSQRWLAALAELPPQTALACLARRDNGMEHRRFMVRDRLQFHTWRTPKPPEMPADDGKELIDGLLNAILARWERAGTMPTDMTSGQLAAFFSLFSGGVSYRGDAKPADLHARMERANARAARFAAIVATWPRTGPASEALLVWDDQHGKSEGLDARVQAVLDRPDLTKLEAIQALRLWVRRGSAARWQRIEAMLTRDLRDPVWQALVQLMLNRFDRDTLFSGSDLSGIMAWRLLQDHRPLPPEVLPQELRHDVDATVADAVAVGLAAMVNRYRHPQPTPENAVKMETLLKSGPSRVERDAAIAALLETYGGQAARDLENIEVPLPPGLKPSEPVSSVDVIPTGSPDLTADEANAVRAVLAEAKTLGFPDLVGAKAAWGEFPGSDWWGVHLRLADGTWLAEEVRPVAHVKIKSEPDWLVPVPGTILQCINQVPSVARGRVQGAVDIGRLNDCSADSVLPALVWWLSGQDPTGKTVVATVIKEAVQRHDVADIWSIAASRGGSERGPVATVPSVADGVRRSVARWFRHQVVWAKDGAEADRAIAAATRMLPPADLPTWEPLLKALRARLDLPTKVSPKADLVTRLQVWKTTMRDAKGHWSRDNKVPATRSDTAELVGLLNDLRPTRWVEDHALPRPVGDAALAALGELWRFDWRWLVVDRPDVQAILPPRTDQHTREVDRGDEWLWAQTAWTAERRAVIMTALQAWWKDHGAAGESPVQAAFRAMPLLLWDEVLNNLPPADTGTTVLGDILAERLKSVPPPNPDLGMEQYAVQVVLKIATCQPRHAGLATVFASWPRQSWMDAIDALRGEFGGNPAAFESWLQDALARFEMPDNPENRESREQAVPDPWILAGIRVHRPSPERLAVLRRIRAQELNDPQTLWVVSHLGEWNWGGDSLFPQGSDAIRGPVGQAIPDVLALDGLQDQRPLTKTIRACLGFWSRERNAIKKLPADARVCDWVAVQMLRYSSVLGPDEAKKMGNADTFMRSDRAKRDAMITHLHDRLEPLTGDNLEAAGLVPHAKEAEGAAKF